MAESEAKQTTQTVQVEEKKLKHLYFVQVAVTYAVVCFSGMYDYSKENAGPLKPGIQAVEGTVKAVIGPVYEKFHDVPLELLKFVDHKVDELINEIDHHMPSSMKQASACALSAALKVPELARSMAFEIRQMGVADTALHLARTIYAKCEPTAKELYSKYEPVAERHAVSAWGSLNRIPLFPQVAGVLVPTAAYWAEKYNRVVCYAVERGYPLAGYIPEVPVEKIGKIFGEAGAGVATNDEYVAVAQ